MSKPHHLMPLAKVFTFIQLGLLAAIFGFFYAYACSAMWGLDLVGGAVAIEAMNGINTAVRNGVFAPAFFGPLPIGVVTLILLWLTNAKTPALLLGTALVVYIVGAFLVTAGFAVPMNRALLAAEIPTDPQRAIEIWTDYSTNWQFWNWIRTGFSGLAFGFTAIAFYKLGGQNTAIQNL